MDTSNTVALWVCIDCMLMHANGEATETPDREPWALWADDPSEITMGLLWSEHGVKTQRRRSAMVASATAKLAALTGATVMDAEAP